MNIILFLACINDIADDFTHGKKQRLSTTNTKDIIDSLLFMRQDSNVNKFTDYLTLQTVI